MVNTCLFDMELDAQPKIGNTSFVFDNIITEFDEYLLEGKVESDAEDGLFSIVESVTNRLQESFDELIGDDTNKKRFIKSLTQIFALLINTKVGTVNKIKRILRIAVETTLKILSRTNVTPKGRPRTSTIPLWLMNRRQRRQRTKPYKIKLMLPEQKQVSIKRMETS